MIRKATEADLDAVIKIYDELHDAEESGEIFVGWIRTIYPTRTTAEESLKRGDLFVLEDGTVLGAGIINQNQVDSYEKGTWQYKTEKEYLCIRDDEEKGFTAEEFKKASAEGWEKQYQYKVGRRKVYMPPSAAEKEGYKRADKHPKATRFGRQNPVSAQWNSEEQLTTWRAQWADAVNRALEKAQVQDRVDHRSHAERGIDEQPTVHEGVSARIMEQKGIRAERSELNRQIKADNKALRELRDTISRLMKAAKEKLNIPAIAEALVELRTSILHNLYRLTRAGEMLEEAKRDIATYESSVKRYYEIGGEIKRAKEDMKVKTDEKRKKQEKQSVFSKAAEKVTTLLSDVQEENLAERIEELRSERKAILSRHGLNDKDEMKILKHNLGVWKKNKSTLEEVSGKWKKQVTADTDKYYELRAGVPEVRLMELDTKCAEIYQASKYDRRDTLQAAYKGKEFDHDMYWNLEKHVEKTLMINTTREKHVYKRLQEDKIRLESNRHISKQKRRKNEIEL